jgi:hypothetical protein
MGLIGGIARTAVVAGTATAVSNRVSRRQANRWAAQEQPQEAPPQEYAPQQAAPAAAPTDSLAQLQQLGELRDSGVLTEAEFQVQKERILAG